MRFTWSYFNLPHTIHVFTWYYLITFRRRKDTEVEDEIAEGERGWGKKQKMDDKKREKKDRGKEGIPDIHVVQIMHWKRHATGFIFINFDSTCLWAVWRYPLIVWGRCSNFAAWLPKGLTWDSYCVGIMGMSFTHTRSSSSTGRWIAAIN